MSVLLLAGGEAGHPFSEGIQAVAGSGTTTIWTTNAGLVTDGTIEDGSHAYSKSYKVTGDAAAVAGANARAFSNALGRRVWLSALVYLPSSPGVGTATSAVILGLNGSRASVSPAIGVRLRASTRELFLAASGGGEIGLIGSAAVLPLDTWTLVQVGLTIDTGATDSAELWVEGVQTHSASGQSLTDTVPTHAFFGWLTQPNSSAGTPRDIYFDHVLVNDDQGSSPLNARPPDSKIALLLPRADVSRDAGWTTGNGGTSNLYDSVDNVPSTGEATSGTTSTSQVENAVSTTTQNYVVEVDSYTEASIPSWKTILAARSIATLGVSATTGANSGHLSLLSNPADGLSDGTTNVEFDRSPDDTVAGAFPTGWHGWPGLVAESPTVTRGTRPQVKLGKRTAATRVHAASQIGVQVLYQDNDPSIAPTGVAAGGGFGSPTLGHTTPQGLSPTGVAVGGGFGSPGLTKLALVPVGIAAGGGFGSPTLSHATSSGLSPTGIAAGGGFGSPALQKRSMAPTGIAAGGGFGQPTLESEEDAGPFTALSGEISIEGGLAGDVTLELPTRITETFDERWASGLHLGAATPTIGVQVRRGRFRRAYGIWTGEEVNAEIAGSNPSTPWQAYWNPDEPYVDVPNVLSFERSRSFSQGGFTTATLVIENIASISQETFHTFHRGYFAPFRGYVAPGATPITDEHGDELTENAWYDVLRRNAQITVHCGYGDEVVKVFTGLVDDVDWTSRPDQITVTLRCFGGKVLADTRVFGWSKDKKIREPVIFIDEDDAQNKTKEGTNVDTSGPVLNDDDDLYGAANIKDHDSSTAWYSDVSDTPNFTEWVEITVPEGAYSSVALNPGLDGQDFYVSVYPEFLEDGSLPTLDGVEISPAEWYEAGLGDVPGINGGIPYVLLQTGVDSGRTTLDLGGTFRMGLGSRIRLSVRELQYISDPDNDGYVAAVTAFLAIREELNPQAVTQKWVRVADVADIVKVICRWAGFKDLSGIEETGVSLSKRLVVNRGLSYRDVIKLCEDAVGFEFYLADPTADDRSIGVPIFRRSRIVSSDAPVLTITDDLLLSEIQVKMTDAPLAGGLIRVRGRESKEGRTLGVDRTKRVWFDFRPPWVGEVDSDTWLRNGGVQKRVIHTNNLFKTTDECRLAAYIIALREAIEAFGAVAQAPAHPGAQLDDHIEVRDLGTGVTSRISVREQRETFTAGEERSWQMTFSGALVDAEWVQDMVAIIEADPGRSD